MVMNNYDWPGQFAPTEWQTKVTTFLVTHPNCLVRNAFGMGIQQAVLWAADCLIKTGKVKKVLVIAPLATLERVWGTGISVALPHYSSVMLYGSASKRRNLLRSDADFYIINHDGFPVVANDISMFDLVIVDAAATMNDSRTKRGKQFREWRDANPQTRLWMIFSAQEPDGMAGVWELDRCVTCW